MQYNNSLFNIKYPNDIKYIKNIDNSYPIQDVEHHCQRVMELSALLAKELNYSKQQLDEVVTAALYHDVGKKLIPREILYKPGRLTEEEKRIMDKHPIYGAYLVCDGDYNKNIVAGVLYHHEYYDGTGYSLGLKGEEIPIIARIISLADSFDAMTSNRVYANARTYEAALKEIKKNAGSQFDPTLVPLFINVVVQKYKLIV